VYGGGVVAGAFQFTTTTMAAPAAGEATTRAYIIMPNDPDAVVYNKRMCFLPLSFSSTVDFQNVFGSF